MSIASGISQFVDGIMPAFQQMEKSKKEKDVYERELAQARKWSSQGFNQKTGQFETIDPNVKNKDILQLVDQKTIDAIANNKSHSIAQKRGELEATAAIMRMQAQQAIRKAAQPRTQYQAAPGFPSRNIPESQAAGYDVQRYAAQERAKANAPKEAREARKEGRDIGRYKKEMGAPERDLIKNAPEIKFFEKNGLPPSAFLRPESVEQGYQAVDPKTKELIGEVAPIQPGKPVPEAYVKLRNLFGQESGREPAEWVAKPGGAYRVKEYKYGGVPTKGIPEETKYRPHPEGEFLQLGDKRVPYDEVASIRRIAQTRHDEAIQALKINPRLLPQIENRLQQWHYDLTDPAWADLYK